jgi:hypothetical protein
MMVSVMNVYTLTRRNEMKTNRLEHRTGVVCFTLLDFAQEIGVSERDVLDLIDQHCDFEIEILVDGVPQNIKWLQAHPGRFVTTYGNEWMLEAGDLEAVLSDEQYDRLALAVL